MRFPVLATAALIALPLVSGATATAQLTAEQQLGPLWGQGIARVFNGWILSSTNALGRVDDELNETARALPALPADWSARGYNHIGDIDVVGNTIYAPLEQPDFTLGVQATARYDATTLAFRDAVELPQHENSFVTIDPKTMTAFGMDHFGGSALLRYDVRHHWKRLSPLRLNRRVPRVQGADIAQGALWLSSDDPTHTLYRVDMHTGSVRPIGATGHAGGEAEGIDATKLSTGLLHVLTVDQEIVPVWLGHYRVITRR